FGGVLVPIRCLVNGRTVVQEQAGSVTYWHVELQRHDVVLAEGLPCESYLDIGNRAAFGGQGTFILHPDFATALWNEGACAPLILAGPLVAALRRRTQLQASLLGHALTDDPALTVRAGGRLLRPDRIGAGLRFLLPPGARALRLWSRRFVPA